MKYTYAMYYMKWYMQTTILTNAKSQVKWTAKTKAKRSQSQKPKAKWARKWEILAPKCMQNRDFSSKMQQIGSKLPQAEKQKQFKKNTPKKYPPMKRRGMWIWKVQ